MPRGSDRRLAAQRAPGAIYLANLCHVIGNFIIFLEASQSPGRAGPRSGGGGRRDGGTTGGREDRERRFTEVGSTVGGIRRRAGGLQGRWISSF